MKICPSCGSELQKVFQSVNSPLNEHQFDLIKAGDYYCNKCKGTRGETGYKYYWEYELMYTC